MALTYLWQCVHVSMASVEAEATHASHHTLEYGGWDDCAVRCGQWILTSSENTGGVEITMESASFISQHWSNDVLC